MIDDEKKIAACVDPAEVHWCFVSSARHMLAKDHVRYCVQAHLVLAKAKEENVEIVAAVPSKTCFTRSGCHKDLALTY